MSLTITEPIKTVEGVITQAIAAESQLLYKFAREDVQVSETLDDVGNVLLNIVGADILEFVTGDLIYVEFPTEYPSGIYTILKAIVSGNLKVTINLPFTITTVNVWTNYITARPNYRVKIVLKLGDGSDLYPPDPLSLSYVPNQGGLLTVDVGDIYSSYLKQFPTFSTLYLLRYTEEWQGSAEVSADSIVLQAVLASKQLLDLGGANMWENLLRLPNINIGLQNLVQGTSNFFLSASLGNVVFRFPSGTPVLLTGMAPYTDGNYIVTGSVFDGTQTLVTVGTPFLGDLDQANSPNLLMTAPQAKFLTAFENPIAWTGWRRSVSTLIDQNFAVRTQLAGTFLVGDYADINKFPLLLFELGYSLDLTPRVRIIGLPTAEIDALRPANTRYLIARMRAANVDINISEDLPYRLIFGCNDGIMIDWINQLGGVDQWLFTNPSIHRIEADGGVVSERPINSDIESITRTKRRFAKSFRERITLSEENLTLDQALALQEIKQTESLRVYLSKDGSQFIDGIAISDLSTTYNTKLVKHKFSLIIELPDDFIFNKAKKY